MSGILICPTHGRQPPLHCCQHIRYALLANHVIDGYMYPIFNIYTCLDCFRPVIGTAFEQLQFDRLMSLPAEDILAIDEQFDALYEAIPKAICCPKCVNTSLINIMNV